MLASRACQWRSLRTLRPDVSTGYHSALRCNTCLPSISRLQTIPRRFSSDDSKHPVNLHVHYDQEKEHWKRSPWKESEQAKNINRKMTLAVKGPKKPSKGLDTNLSRNAPPKYSKARQLELKYADDPLALAKFVDQRLSQGYEKESLDLVRLATKDGINCVVSWNHLMNNEFKKGRIQGAYKLYNEMKKRGQPPDSYTYSVLLRGYAENAHVKHVLAQALSVYHSMSAPNSKVPPSVIHTNAALKVCVRANDADAVWGVASKIPDGGPNAANALTFTTILNFLRQSALINGVEGESEEQKILRCERVIVDGRRIWSDVVGKWSAHQLGIDEELVCAMGRLLLVGSRPRDWDDVLSLLAQTMDIPRLVPRLGTVTPNSEHNERTRRVIQREPAAIGETELYDPEVRASQGTEFLPLTQKTVGIGKATPLLYVKPGNNTLSLIQEACLKIIANKESTAYWNLLTDQSTYGIKPDLNNLNMRLRLLRQNRASREAVEIIERDIPNANQKAGYGTFRIAMSTCTRDKNNPNALDHAGRILDAMVSTLVDVDPITSSMYADLVFKAAKDAQAVKTALQKLEPVLASIKIQLGFGRAGEEGKGVWPLTPATRVDAMETIRNIYKLYERVLIRKEVADVDARPFIDGRSRLSALLNRLDFINRRKTAALRARRNEEKEEGDEEDGETSAPGGDRQSPRTKRVRARDRKQDIEIFEAWEQRSTERRDRGRRRNEIREKEAPESAPPRSPPPRENQDQWDRFDHFKQRQVPPAPPRQYRDSPRQYRDTKSYFGVNLE